MGRRGLLRAEARCVGANRTLCPLGIIVRDERRLTKGMANLPFHFVLLGEVAHFWRGDVIITGVFVVSNYVFKKTQS